MMSKLVKRILPIGIVLAFIVSCASTTADTSAPAQTTTSVAASAIDRIIADQIIRVGMTAEQPPFNVISKDGVAIGLDVDLARTLAQGMGVKLTIVRKPFAELLPALEKGEVDMVISGMAVTLERSKNFNFVGPYLLSGKSLLTTKATLEKLAKPHDINEAKYRVVALKGSTSADFVGNKLKKSTLIEVDHYLEGVEKLRNGEADGMVADMPVCVMAQLMFPEDNLMTLEPPFNLEPLGIAINKNDPQFANLITNFFNTIEKSGMLTLMQAKWLKSSAWMQQLPNPPALKPAAK
ncbi:transporter substrate-binding domain-containing protein [Corallincola spongiicola]|uniref:Transporter substrate-binding domain-containing protein n=1 Tax=Corallincola spongiicola TaxID=2520508 RepID=A0ABY1WL34_9GAMM|nr:transporter substrate-binding domain-containing protein [Corallincola spongiicola]TAA41060.1 transporter substrate-binding domain-containing protein [Corallincola spongiicola]